MKYTQLIENTIPQYLYHATYKPYLKSIMQNGIGGNNTKNWSDSKSNMVYLANDPEIAYSFAETAEELPDDDWLDQIVVLKIDTNLIDKNKLNIDSNIVLDNSETPYSYEYNGTINKSAISIITTN